MDQQKVTMDTYPSGSIRNSIGSPEKREISKKSQGMIENQKNTQYSPIAQR
jgi:hypothetical protein